MGGNQPNTLDPAKLFHYEYFINKRFFKSNEVFYFRIVSMQTRRVVLPWQRVLPHRFKIPKIGAALIPSVYPLYVKDNIWKMTTTIDSAVPYFSLNFLINYDLRARALFWAPLLWLVCRRGLALSHSHIERNPALDIILFTYK